MTLNTNLLRIGSLVLAIAVSVTACSKSADDLPKTDSETSESASVVEGTSINNSEESMAIESKETNEVSKKADEKISAYKAIPASSNVLANMAVKTASMSLDGMTSAGVLNDKQTKCVKAINLKSQVPVVHDLIYASFDAEEVKELSDFYSQPAVEAVTDFGREQMLIMMGLQVELKATQPSKSDMQKVIGFSETAIGKKFTEFNMKEGENTMNGKLSGFIISELKKCGIDPQAEAVPKP